MVLTVKSDLLDIVGSVSGKIEFPKVREVFLPEPRPSPDRDAEFGIVVLEDGSAGLYYAWLGGEQSTIREKFNIEDFRGIPALELAARYRNEDPCECSLGLATINAMTRSFYQRTGYNRPQAPNAAGGLNFEVDDHVGMIGYFPSLVRRLRECGINLTVVEKKTKFLEQDDTFRVVLTPGSLKDCNKVVITASTMLNNTIDEVLLNINAAADVVMVGPTAGFFPDPLFDMGVTAIGGSEVLDADKAITRIRADARMSDATRKFLMYRDHYPGTGVLACPPQASG